MDELIVEFIAETREGIEALDSELVRFEQSPNDPDTLGGVFRLIHTIKGTCGFLGLSRLQSVAHAAENVLAGFRDGTVNVSPSSVTAVLDTVDLIRSLLEGLAITGSEPEGDDHQLILRLETVVSAPSVANEPVVSLEVGVDDRKDDRSLIIQLGNDATIDAAVEMALPTVRQNALFKNADYDLLQAAIRDALCDVARKPGLPSALSTVLGDLTESPLNSAVVQMVFESVAETLKALDISEGAINELRSRVIKTPKSDSGLKQADLNLSLDQAASDDFGAAANSKLPPQPLPGQPPKAADKLETQTAGQTIRVSVDALEHLMTVVSELVLIRNQLIQTLRLEPESAFAAPLNRLNQVTSELQEGVMTTRMQPISGAWAKLPRLVRDLGQELGKSIELSMFGQDTELDRQVLELIKDPLTHMIRNAADHGLEPANVRESQGKPAVGRIVLQARHEGGAIVIEVSDDGRGLSPDKIKAKAAAIGLLTTLQADNLTDAEAKHLIFMPGFSTASEVTAVSGRGVGMDVVKTNIEKIGGNIELSSQERVGTRFTIRIPLTLTIVSALIVECCGERFAMPQSSVIELVSASGASGRSIEYIDGSAVLRLRDRLLPLISLQSLLGLEPSAENQATETCIAVARVGSFTFGIIVDRVFDTEEIVVKPVATVLRHIKLYSGATIMGDGSVILILDFKGISTATGAGQTSASMHEEHFETNSATSEPTEAILLFRTNDGAIKAAPLSAVSRIEEISSHQVEMVDGRSVVQYRGRLMPIVGSDAGPAKRWDGDALRPLLVFTEEDHSVGFLVNEIVDIVESTLALDLTSVGAATKGSLIIDGVATELIDVAYYRRCGITGSSRTNSHLASKSYPAKPALTSRRLLIIDQSPFSQMLLHPLLTQAGYEVTVATDPKVAQSLYQQGAVFDLIMADTPKAADARIFAEALADTENWHDTPLLSLSMHKRPVIDAPKIGSERLLDAVSGALSQLKGAA